MFSIESMISPSWFMVHDCGEAFGSVSCTAYQGNKCYEQI